MSIGINLHAVVRAAITTLHPDITATLYQSTGQITQPDGAIKSLYAPGRAITAQAQSEGATTLYHADRVGMEEINRKFYLYSEPELASRIGGIIRPLSRGGDVFQLENGTWWLVDAILEDFTLSGWACVRATLQVIAPDFSFSDWGQESPPAEKPTGGQQ